MGTQVTNQPQIPGFECTRQIGAGSFGEVWLARDMADRYRAIKVIRRARFRDDAPFEREFEAIQRYADISRQHPALIDILHVGRCEDGFFYVMYLADSLHGGQALPDDSYTPRTLATTLADRGRLPIESAVEDVMLLLGGLTYLHRAGLVHRDIKPSNIIYHDHFPVLADIGLVSRSDEGLAAIGTHGYLPPEGSGKPAGDIYAIGKLLYVMVSGMDVDSFPSVPSLIDGRDERLFGPLNRVLLKACHSDPKKRHADAHALWMALRRLFGRRKRTEPAVAGKAAGDALRQSRRPSQIGEDCAEFRGRIFRLIDDAKRSRTGVGQGPAITADDFSRLAYKIGIEFERKFGSLPPEVRVARRAAEMAFEPGVFERSRLLKSVIALSVAFVGGGFIVRGIAAILGWKQGIVAKVVNYFSGSATAVHIGIIVAGFALVGAAIAFLRHKPDPVHTANRALRVLREKLDSAIDAVWSRQRHTSTILD